MPEIVPSILSANFVRLAEDIARVEGGGISMLHIDIMDGHFVPNMTIGPPVVKSIRKTTKLTLDVHLMITNPDQFVPLFVEAGADQISVHQETCPHLDRTLRFIQSEGALAGVVLNPSTPIAMLEDVLDVADFVLIMSVNPGFGGQKLIPRALEIVKSLAARRRELGLHFPIEIDGGVTMQNVGDVIRAGVDWVVAGASVFLTPDPAATAAQMRRIAEEAASVRV
ncbi:MAG: ribulose-phosphate 3-epimerase [Acidobacteriales bacterium]|nr:MAG: ribulose-phosphate 3-epimerase [Terriglobales bacterium]